MIDSLIEIGDKVIVTIPQENREWGYNPCKDGTIATVVGFSERYVGRYRNFIRPGVYESRVWVKLKDPDGKIWSELSARIELEDKEEYADREIKWRSEKCLQKEILIRELPEDKFYPLDKVTSFIDWKKENFIVLDREYNWEKSPYRVEYEKGAGYTCIDEDKLTLISRGNCWNYYHNLPLVFSSLKEEAEFYKNINQTISIPNPNSTKLPYSWTLGEALEQIKLGNAHALSVSGGFFGASPHLEVIKYNNVTLGEKLAQQTLLEFTDEDFIKLESEKQLSRRNELLELFQ